MQFKGHDTSSVILVEKEERGFHPGSSEGDLTPSPAPSAFEAVPGMIKRVHY